MRTRKEIEASSLTYDGYLDRQEKRNEKEVQYAILETLLDIRDLLTPKE